MRLLGVEGEAHSLNKNLLLKKFTSGCGAG